MTSRGNTNGPSTGRGLWGWLWRVAVCVTVPPLVTLAVFFTGLGVDHLRTEYVEIRFLVSLLLIGPLAFGAGIASAVKLSISLLGGSRTGWVLAVVLIFVSLVTIWLVYSWAFLHFIGQGWS